MSKIKTISFDYAGGTYIQQIDVRGTNIPWHYECDAEWIKIEADTTSISITVPTIYDFHDRSGIIVLIDRFGNKLELVVEQKGYYNLSVECAKSLVLYHSYYDMHHSFDFYVTVYGGNTQSPICEGLEDNLIQVWDNSDMYNDYVLRIPETVSGDYIVEHSDAREFIEYCDSKGISYDISKLIKNISIVQVSTEDVIGTIEVSVYGKKYRSGDDCCITVTDDEWVDISIDSTKYIHVESNTKYSVIDERLVDCQKMAEWVDYVSNEGIVRVKAKNKNLLSERSSILRLVNRTNAHQYIDIIIKQESEA